MTWDMVVVGAGPGGAAAALGALAAEPGLSVLLLDRQEFPRDKVCGDGIAPEVFDLLAGAGVDGVVDDRTPVRRLSLRRGRLGVERLMARPAYVVPRLVFDARLVEAAQAAGAVLRKQRVARVEVQGSSVMVDDEEARMVVGADGAHSLVRKTLGVASGPVALALRGYAPTPADRAERQVIVFGTARQPSYAWSFDRGDGWSNIGYGEQLRDGQEHPTRAGLLRSLEELLPGASADATDWRGHQLPLSSWAWRPQAGRVMLVGDAAGLINPMTGEGIYYAIATGMLAGKAAAEAIGRGSGDAGTAYRRGVEGLLGKHLRHTALLARLTRSGRVLDAGIRASAADQRVFDNLVEIGLADGVLRAASLRQTVRRFIR
ncbi:NAD(P)/FAD-dependent oxidoreductase [Kribbella sp. CA-293567]|uniref:NAD(P)/FAD-dependent oxidoreductase n=1 Tax=Kribbella sp. CA-293567 TaxID=3002436 RepID=UPI0022DE4BF0|nr:NAD(P)/FAD-dependent oxidoreductase [Kribbella sp. CA-293567]WBQ03544.1 NAD(P)/FAD-dependent oxidoreductase [Kribbella sp. CA-293567]